MTIEEQLKKIDLEIRKLKIAYDLYFIGSRPRPPVDQRDAIDKMLKQYQNTPMKNVADRFLYNAIVNRFNAFQELWNKGTKTKEEGVRVHPLAARAAHQAAGRETGGSHRPGSAPAVRRAAKRRADGEVASGRIPITARDDQALKNLYQNFIAAKADAGDRKQPTFDAFAREIARHTAALKGRVDCDAIDFKIYSKDNKVSIKAKLAK